MSVRAGIVVTGTEVLTGRIADRNGPWVSQSLLDLGVDVAHITICGDRPDDLTAQLKFLADVGVDLIITSGGLGPTADDLTVATVAEFCGLELRLDVEIQAHITTIIERWRRNSGRSAGGAALAAGIRKQAMIPAGAQAIPPVGTAPGVAIAASSGRPAVLILPGPPGELQGMWESAVATAPVAAVLADSGDYRTETLRAYRLSEPDLAESLRIAQGSVAGFAELEITTCLRGGEVEVVTRFLSDDAAAYAALVEFLTKAHGRQIFSSDGSTIDEVLIARLDGRTVATAESCTGGLIAARLTDRPGSSAYFLGGVAAYANEVKTRILGVPAELIVAHGAVSEEVAEAMADGAREHLGTDAAVSTTGIAGPDGGSDRKPVGTVCFGISIAGQPTSTTTLVFPGNRATVRALATTAAMHLLSEAMDG
ncbi:competence/damage-inducible protein A [Gordonia sp. TBRC 11910]|uniref:CinA-like protein n=1 Tax=Gordonia asplenii TaxID=2725283 RepID=A0A848KVL8_9ACTN|nr:competence/damage-inducible protein A [Gordonia asplenii]NMO02904.1 competence/damage-inducible protein A [Gordonia asplenii]